MSVVPSCPPGGCQVWWAGAQALAAEQLAWLSPAEHERRERFRRDADRDRFTTATVVLRSVLGEHLGMAADAVPLDRSCERCGGNHGRPRVPGTPYAVSIAHAGDWVAVACGRLDAVGIDVEAVGRARTSASMTRLVLAPAERDDWAGLAEADQPRAFTHYWTAKEAVLKATGDGLRVPMTRLTISPPAAGRPTLRTFTGRDELPSQLRLTRLDRGSDYDAALATVGADGPVTEHDATPLLLRSARDVAL